MVNHLPFLWFFLRNKYLFCQKPGRKEHKFYRDLYPQILQEIEVIIVELLLQLAVILGIISSMHVRCKRCSDFFILKDFAA